MKENFHTHTARCRHATGTEEEYVQQAIAGGLQILGFSDHTPFRFPGSYYSHMRMYPEELKDYVTTVLALKEKYAGQIDIRLGLEVEYYPDRIPALLDMIAPFEIEYLLLGQHWCGNEQNEPYNGRPTEDVALLSRYCDQVIAGMQTGLFSYVAHPDLLYFVSDPKAYATQMTRLCLAAKELSVPLELNFLGLREHRQYPREDFWKIAGEIGCPVVFGCDAHQPQHVTDAPSEKTALEMVDTYRLQFLDSVPIHPWSNGGI
ncbi:MAG: histidinol-phosphatase [Oscillospiraceae bacterium]|nr:histidinol-phosphatase [Oscillospiraceae bacterium]